MYLIAKLFHVVAVILFLGNIITGLFWKFHAERARDVSSIAQVFDGIIRSDRYFTIPGSVAIVGAGIWAAVLGNFPILGTGWILWSIVLFTISGVIFMLRIAPLQRAIRGLARMGAQSGQFDWARYRTLAHAWDLWGLAAMLTPVAAVVLMVLKPDLPAL